MAFDLTKFGDSGRPCEAINAPDLGDALGDAGVSQCGGGHFVPLWSHQHGHLTVDAFRRFDLLGDRHRRHLAVVVDGLHLVVPALRQKR